MSELSVRIIANGTIERRFDGEGEGPAVVAAFRAWLESAWCSLSMATGADAVDAAADRLSRAVSTVTVDSPTAEELGLRTVPPSVVEEDDQVVEVPVATDDQVDEAPPAVLESARGKANVFVGLGSRAEAALFYLKAHAPSTPKAIGEAIKASKATVRGTLRELESVGLVLLERGNVRTRLVHLTQAGVDRTRATPTAVEVEQASVDASTSTSTPAAEAPTSDIESMLDRRVLSECFFRGSTEIELGRIVASLAGVASAKQIGASLARLVKQSEIDTRQVGRERRYRRAIERAQR